MQVGEPVKLEDRHAKAMPDGYRLAFTGVIEDDVEQGVLYAPDGEAVGYARAWRVALFVHWAQEHARGRNLVR